MHDIMSFITYFDDVIIKYVIQCAKGRKFEYIGNVIVMSYNRDVCPPKAGRSLWCFENIKNTINFHFHYFRWLQKALKTKMVTWSFMRPAPTHYSMSRSFDNGWPLNSNAYLKLNRGGGNLDIVILLEISQGTPTPFHNTLKTLEICRFYFITFLRFWHVKIWYLNTTLPVYFTNSTVFQLIFPRDYNF